MTVLYALNRIDMSLVGKANGSNPSGLSFVDDRLVIDDDSPAQTFEATLVKGLDTESDISGFDLGTYVTFLDPETKEHLLFTITDVDGDHGSKTIFCESAGMDLLNDNAPAVKFYNPYNIAYYVDRFFGNTDWAIGINEISDLTRTLEWEGTSNKYERLLSIANSFDKAKVYLSVKMDANQVVGKYINFKKNIGEDNGVIFEYGRNTNNITRKGSIVNLATALEATGATPEGSDNPIGLVGYAYDDGRFHTPKTSSFIFDRLANQTWFRTLSGSRDGEDSHFKDYYSNEKGTTQATLFQYAKSELEKRSKPELTYEVDIAYLDKPVGRGDTVYIKDLTFQPAIMVAATVSKIERSIEDATKGTLYFKNFVEMESNLDRLVSELNNKINDAYNIALNNIKPVFSELEPLNPVEGMTWYKLAPLEQEASLVMRVAQTDERKVVSTNVYQLGVWETIPFDAEALYVKKLTGLTIENPYQIAAGSGNLRSVKGVSRMSNSLIGMDYEYLDGGKTKGATTMSPGTFGGSEYTQAGQFVGGFSMSADSISLNSNFNGQQIGGALTSKDFYDTGWLQLTATNGWRFYTTESWGYVRQIGKDIFFKGLMGGKAGDFTPLNQAIALPTSRFLNWADPDNVFLSVSANGTGFNQHTMRAKIVNGNIQIRSTSSNESFFGLNALNFKLVN